MIDVKPLIVNKKISLASTLCKSKINVLNSDRNIPEFSEQTQRLSKRRMPSFTSQYSCNSLGITSSPSRRIKIVKHPVLWQSTHCLIKFTKNSEMLSLYKNS